MRRRHPLVQEVRGGAAHGGQGLLGAHGQEAHPHLAEGGNHPAVALEIGEEVLSQAHDQLVPHAPQIEPGSGRLVRLQPVGERGRDPVLGEVAEVDPECVQGLPEPRPQRVQLLELIEHENGGEEAVVGAPELQSGAVEVLPETLPFPDGRGVDLPLLQLVTQPAGHLDAQGRGVRPEGEPHVDRQEAPVAKPGEEARLEQRGLAEPGLAEQDRDRRLEHPTEERRRLLFSPVEEVPRRLLEGVEPRPGVVPVQDEQAHLARRPVPHAAPARRIARISPVSVASSSGLGAPAGACPKCSCRKSSGTCR